MARMGLNFGTPSPRLTVSRILLVLACAGIALSFAQRSKLMAAIAEEQAAVVRLENAVVQQPSGQSLLNIPPRAIEEAKALRRALQSPWEAMLDDLQRTATTGILLNQVQPAADGKVLVSGRADSSREFTAYIARLRKRAGWKAVTPVGEALGAPDISGKPLAFQLMAEYARHE